MRKITVFIVLFLVLLSCSEKTKEKRLNKQEIQISGAFALYPMIIKWAEEFRKLYPDVRIDVSGGGAGKGMTDVISGMVDIGMVSREIYEEEIKRGAYSVIVAKDAVIPTININNPEINNIRKIGLKKDIAIKLWNKEISYWGEIFNNTNNIPVRVYTRSDACGAGETWASWLGKAQEDLEGTAIFGDPGVASTIQRDKLGISYNNMAYVYNLKTKRPFKDLGIIPIDINNDGKITEDENFYQNLDSLIKAVSTNKYPNPPARNLYLVTKGKPVKPIVIKFIHYILTEGQKHTNENGFIGLPEEMIKEELSKLNYN